jgi:KipI family sensor histidine kinase inhibitor
MRDTPPRLLDASDHSLLVALADEISTAAHLLVRRSFAALQEAALPGVTDLHPAYASLLVSYDPALVERGELRELVAERLRRSAAVEPAAPGSVEVPVVYGGEEGPDLEAVAVHCGLPADEVVRRHAGGEYFVHFVGFSPGFPYLGGMPPELAVPRRATPRTRVPAGSVAIGGAQSGIYPLPSPGGWNLVGRTPLALFDPRRTPPALLGIGDRVRFVPVPAGELSGWQAAALPAAAPAGGAIRVLAGGFQSTVQDLGRAAHAHLGVSACGAADPLSLKLGNWLVGNPDAAAGVEMTLVGGSFLFTEATAVALAGSEFAATLDERALPLWSAVEVRPGQTLRLGPTRVGARCTLCVRGGIGVEPLLGSRSTHLTSALGGLGGRALQRGDELSTGRPRAGNGLRRFDPALAARLLARITLRVVPGAQWERFPAAARAALGAAPYRVTEDSSRMGLRLAGAPLRTSGQGEMVTEGVSLGALQVPPDGQPIISFVEHQTTGGYPQIACVIAADLHRVGQLRPRDEVRLVVVTLAEADAALRELRAAVRAGRIGA